MPEMEMRMRSAGWRVKVSGGTMPVPVRRTAPWGKLVSRKRYSSRCWAVRRIRGDSRWNVPEPELVICADARGRIVGYTIGNDMSSRDIEGENPLYLPQAKTFTGCAALGPGLLVSEKPLAPTTSIEIEIQRRGRPVFCGATRISEMRKRLTTLVEYLFRDNSFPVGCLLMTGTGVVPPGRFSLRRGDEVRITIDPIGTLVNPVR